MLKRFWPLLAIVIIVVLAAIIIPAAAGLMPHTIIEPETYIDYWTLLTLDSPLINIPDDVKSGESFEISGRLSYVDKKYSEQIASLMENEVIEKGSVSAEQLFSLIPALVPAEDFIPLPFRRIRVYTKYGTAKNYYDIQTEFKDIQYVYTDTDGYFNAIVQIDEISQWHKWIGAGYLGEYQQVTIDGSRQTVYYRPSFDYIPEDAKVKIQIEDNTVGVGIFSDLSIISIVIYVFLSIFIGIIAYFIYRYRKKLLAWLKRRKTLVTVQEPANIQTSLSATNVVREVSTGDPRVEILFPQIENQLPPVWGIGEPLTIMSYPLIETPENDIKTRPQIKTANLAIDISIPAFTSVQVEHSFSIKGETDINIYFGGDTIAKMSGTRKIKIVDYREEIVELFNRLIDTLSAKGINVDRMMTAREIESKLTDKYRDFSPDTMKDIVKGFEYANYSLHPVARKIYVDTYVAVEKIEERVKNA
jgi:hypothetical protein